MAKALMFVGTSSESGKSVMAAAFCRIFMRKNCRVAPFKSQNMALNSGVTPDGREMGRAQIVQAEAAGIEPCVDMNPVLLKPTSEKGSQVVVRGLVRGNFDAADYYRHKQSLWPDVTGSYDRLADAYDVVVLEGAGSPVEMNLKKNDIVNMAMAEYAGARVILVADIDRGGVFAAVVGTVELLEQHERDRLIGIIINKFRGDPALLQDGLDFIYTKTGFPVLGVVPCLHDLYIPGEDSVALERKRSAGAPESALASIGILQLPHIANYTDFDPLECDPRFSVAYVASAGDLGRYDAVVIPGSKNVFYDYRFLEKSGIAAQLERYRSGGGRIAGICGGFQMLGETIRDPHGVESDAQELQALGFLPVCSVMDRSKVTERVGHSFLLPGTDTGISVSGYEIHMGRTVIREGGTAVSLTDGAAGAGPAGIASPDGKVWGTYLHGLFDSDLLRDGFLAWIHGGRRPVSDASFDYRSFKEKNYDRLADTVEQHVDVPLVMTALGLTL